MKRRTEAWRAALASFLKPPCALVGVGNPLRGDDAFGPLLIRRLRGRVDVPLYDAGVSPENWLGRILSRAPRRVLVLDAVRGGRPPGSIEFFPAASVPFAGCSGHSLSLNPFFALLAEAGVRAGLLGVEPARTGLASPLSPPVTRAMERIARAILGDHALGAAWAGAADRTRGAAALPL